MDGRKRGRTRKHLWVEFQKLDEDYSYEAVFLRWASVNNPALAECAQSGCPRCSRRNYRLRHDRKFDNIRFYCPDCGFETSYHIIHPKKSLHSIDIYDNRGMLIGLKNIDDFHDKTKRESSDSQVLNAERNLDLGGEWFDGVSGTNSQSRYLTREDILKLIEERKMKRLMKAALEEIEREEQEHRSSTLEEDMEGESIDNIDKDTPD